MALFDFLYKKDNGQFLPEEKFEDNTAAQEQLAPHAVDLLRMTGFEDDKPLMVEFFFYTNSLDKANKLANKLEKRGYEIYSADECNFKKGLFSITGRTEPIDFGDENAANWAKEMCEIGYIFDCEFDGWGTTPDQ